MIARLNLANLLRVVGLAFSLASRSARAQDQPAVLTPPSVPGFQLPNIAGTLRYSVSASDSVSFGYTGNGQNSNSADFSANLAYLSLSQSHPFSAIYSGGYVLATSDEPSSFFQDLALSQSFVLRPWSFVLTNTFSYIPNSPVGGLSGVPGLGDLTSLPTTAIIGNPVNGLISYYGSRLYNTSVISVSRNLTNRTSIFGSGSTGIQRFPGSTGVGVDTNQDSGSVGFSHQLGPRTALSGSYAYSRSVYPDYGFAYTGHTGSLSISHQWTQRLSTDAFVGPQYSTTSSEPSTLSLAFTGHLSYTIDNGNLGLSFVRGTNNGQGVTTTSLSDVVTGNASHGLGGWSYVSATGSYSHLSTLPSPLGQQFRADSLILSGQISRSITRTLSAYASYTLQHQITDGSSIGLNALNGSSQTVGFGVTYAPARPMIVGR